MMRRLVATGLWLGGFLALVSPAYADRLDDVRLIGSITLSNTTTETPMYTVTVPGGSIGPTDEMHFEVLGGYRNNSNAPQTLTVRVKYGASTYMRAVIPNIPPSVSLRALRLSGSINAFGHVMWQFAHAHLILGALDSDDGIMLSPFASRHGQEDDPQEDTTVTKNFIVTIQHSAAFPGLTWFGVSLRLWIE